MCSSRMVNMKNYASHEGLRIVPLGANHFTLSPTAVSDVHPWRDVFLERESPPADWTTTPSTSRPPVEYTHHEQLKTPPSREETDTARSYYRSGWTREIEPQETIRLCDVEVFRKNTAEKAVGTVDRGWLSSVAAGMSNLFSGFKTRPVIYRFVDVTKDSFALLEAIHFELFMPDRPDLRFLAFKSAAIPSGTLEGDYYRILEVHLISNPSFGVKLGSTTYPVLFKVSKVEKIEFGGLNNLGLAYTVKKKTETPASESIAVSEISDRDFSLHGAFPEHSLVRVTSRDVLPAHLYPVEPPMKRKPEVPWLIDSVTWIGALLSGKEYQPPLDYLSRIRGVRTSSQHTRRDVSARAPSATEAARIEDRLGLFSGYGHPGDLQLMRELFGLGCVFRSHASSNADAKEVGETRIDESVILKTLSDNSLGPLTACRPLLDCIYDMRRRVAAIPRQPPLLHGSMLLNAAQACAVRAYADASGPRVFCILSPPGSGKTTVASAMAATVAISNKMNPRAAAFEGVQLLLSVQNVAVDNMGAALKKMEHGGAQIYNMKSTKKLDPHNPAPFDFFDLMSKEKLEKWRTGKQDMERKVWNQRDRISTKEKFESYEDCLDYNRREYEKKLSPKIVLSTVELMLYKTLNATRMTAVLGDVRRVIIDEASLLTEAALFCIIRRFPTARIVLIGDDHQLPPFMYDEKILGHELAGRPALSVAMKTGKVPVVELNEVYRAPPSIVAPYNRLAYGGRLVSNKFEGHRPLSDIDLIHSEMPQLLLVDVDGKEERSNRTMSLYNTKELEAVVRLLKKFPHEWTKDVMIICLYKEQKWKLQQLLKHKGLKQYSVLTVDSAQGKEAPIVILLTTRTQRANDFFCSRERCNVSISRQQKALIILGKAALLTTNKPWCTVVNGVDFTCIQAVNIK